MQTHLFGVDQSKGIVAEWCSAGKSEYIEAIFIQPYIKAVHLSDNSKYKVKTRKTATSILNKLVELTVLDPPKKIGREIVYINSTLINILSDND